MSGLVTTEAMLNPPARSILLGALFAVVITSPSGVSGQGVSVDLQTSVRSSYEWRGLRLDPGATLQYAASVSNQWGPSAVSAGVWSVTDLSSSEPGLPSDWFFEASPWVEFAYGSERGRFRVGGTGYLIREDAAEGALRRGDTWEVYVAADAPVPRTPFSVRAALFRDVDRIEGGYADVGATLRVPLWVGLVVPVGSLFIDADAGFALGAEDAGGENPDAFLYAERGMTHLDLSARTTLLPISMGGWDVSFTLEVHRVQGFDRETERFGWSLDEGVKVTRWWWGLGVRWRTPRCRPDRELCRDL